MKGIRSHFCLAVTGVLCAGLLCISNASADVQLSSLFADDMVLQREQKVPIWGSADAGEVVTVSFENQKKTVTTAENGEWRVELDPLPATTSATLTIEGKNKIELQRVAVGEVWVCSGQSNMEWPLINSKNGKEEIAAADYPQIRLFTVAKAVSETPRRELKGKWEPCSPQTAGSFSAVGYYFGRELHRVLGVPIGLIDSSWGGTPAEAWTSRPALEADTAFAPYLKRWEQLLADYPQVLAEHEKKIEQWKKDTAQAKADGKPAPRRPSAPHGPTSPHRPASLFNGMIAPLIPYATRGAIWYQGESNASRADNYRVLFPTMIRDWREKWGQGDFPFYWVQLANYMARKDQPGESAWAELRDAQLQTLSLPNTGMAVTIDVGEAKDIHPRDKHTVGFRLAQAALAGTYQKPVAGSGPIYDSMTVEGNKIRLRFKNVDGGLKTKFIANPDVIVPLGHWVYGGFELLHKAGLAEPLEVGADGAIKPLTRQEVAMLILTFLKSMPEEAFQKWNGNRETIGDSTVSRVRIFDFIHAAKFVFVSEMTALDEHLKVFNSSGQPMKANLQGFAIAGEDRKWVWADARIDGDTVIVSSEAVQSPVAVRYGWADNPAANLYNGAGLPASPFRTDDWPLTTVGK